jgi:hypothetical protein
MFAACGDDSSSTSVDPSSEESSSSEKSSDKSSSSKKKKKKPSSSVSAENSSSSEAPESSSSFVVVVPEGARIAKLEDLLKNMELKLFDQTVYLSTGRKQGLMAFRIPDELWVVTYTDFADGVVSIEKGNSGVQYSETDAAKKIVEKVNEGFKMSFVVDAEDRILYSVDGSDYSEAIKASVAVQKDKLSKADSIQNKIYECSDGDSTKIFKFLDSSYAYETSVEGNVVNKHEGHYDIQRSTLLMLPLREEDASISMFIYSVGTDNTITSQSGETMNCSVKDVE